MSVLRHRAEMEVLASTEWIPTRVTVEMATKERTVKRVCYIEINLYVLSPQ